MIRFVPGVIGVLAAYPALVLTGWIDSGWARALIFFGVYLFVTVAVDRAMSSYRQGTGKN